MTRASSPGELPNAPRPPGLVGILRTAVALAGWAVIVAASAGCPPGRFASCENDDQCPSIDGGKLICYNLRCVECHYDGDCANGGSCNANGICETLHKPDKEEELGPPPATLEECAKRCKGNPSCGDDCRERFRK